MDDVENSEPTLREELEAAFGDYAVDAAAEEAAPEKPAPKAEEHAIEAKPPAPKPAAEKAPVAAEGAPPGPKREPSRVKAPATGTAAPESAPEKPAKPVPADKAPLSWTPAAREYWPKLPADVRAEIQRRERDVVKFDAERRAGKEFSELIRPYEQLFKQSGMEPAKAVASVLQAYADLRTAAPVDRARIVATLIRDFGVPIGALDSALASVLTGQPMPQETQPQYRDPRFDQLMGQIKSAQEQRQQQMDAEAQSEVEAFGQDKEFFHDVRDIMADIVEVADRNGQELNLEEAYQRAIVMRPDIAKVIAQREAAKAAANRSRSTQRARLASSSVRGSAPVPSTTVKEGGPSLREELEAAFARSAR